MIHKGEERGRRLREKHTQLELINPMGTLYLSYKSLPVNQHTALNSLHLFKKNNKTKQKERIRPVSSADRSFRCYWPVLSDAFQIIERLHMNQYIIFSSQSTVHLPLFLTSPQSSPSATHNTVEEKWESPTVNTRMLGYPSAAAISSVALNAWLTVNCMLLCPPHNYVLKIKK